MCVCVCVLYQRHVGMLDTAHVLSAHVTRLHYDSVDVSDPFEKACFLVVPSIKQEPTAFIFKASDDAGSRFLCRRYGVMAQNTSLNLQCTGNLTYHQGFSAN